MNDIIPIIRQCQLDEPVMSLLQDAADEIERLRNLVDQCDHHEHSLQEAHERLAALEDENGRLRGLIRRAAAGLGDE